jgi:hypothetical protein
MFPTSIKNWYQFLKRGADFTCLALCLCFCGGSAEVQSINCVFGATPSNDNFVILNYKSATVTSQKVEMGNSRRRKRNIPPDLIPNKTPKRRTRQLIIRHIDITREPKRGRILQRLLVIGHIPDSNRGILTFPCFSRVHEELSGCCVGAEEGGEFFWGNGFLEEESDEGGAVSEWAWKETFGVWEGGVFSANEGDDLGPERAGDYCLS